MLLICFSGTVHSEIERIWYVRLVDRMFAAAFSDRIAAVSLCNVSIVFN